MTNEEIIQENNPRVGAFYKMSNDYLHPCLATMMSLCFEHSMVYKVISINEENSTVTVEGKISGGDVSKEDFFKMFTSLKVLNFERTKK